VRNSYFSPVAAWDASAARLLSARRKYRSFGAFSPAGKALAPIAKTV
jgi:hypothetical protein